MHRSIRAALRSFVAAASTVAFLAQGAQTLPARADDSDPGTPPPVGTELVEKRTAFMKTFATEEPNVFRSEIHARPIHYLDAAGEWTDIDTSLVPAANGHLASAANSIHLDVAPTASGRLATLTLADGSSFGFGLTGALPVAPVADDTLATFTGVLPGVDVDITSRYNGLKEELVLASAAAPTTYVFPLYLNGLSAALDADGNVILRDAGGTERARIPHGHMTDSKIDPHSGDPAISSGVTYALLPTGPTGTALRVTVDPLWLASPARQFPVSVDPTVYTAGSDDTFVELPYTNDYSTDVLLKSGTYDSGTNKSRSFIHFDGANALDGKVISSATAQIYENWAFSCSGRDVNLMRITQAWSGAGLHAYPGFSVSGIVDTVNTARGYTGCVNGPAYVNFDATPAVTNWASNAWANYGLALVAASETDSYGWKKWDSTQAANDPKLSVTWSEPNSAPGRPAGRSVGGNTCSPCTAPITADPTPALTGGTSDPDGDTLKYYYEVYTGWLTATDAGGGAYTTATAYASGSTAYLASGANSTWTPPTLPDGKYSYRLRAFDGAVYGGWSSGWVNFTVDASAPATSLSSSTHPVAATWYPDAAPAFSWSATSESGIKGYSYVLDQTSTTVPDTTTEGTATTKSYTGVADGLWYFHVRAQNNANVWGTTATLTLRIDVTAPGAITGLTSPTHNTLLPSSNRNVRVDWTAPSDATSGVAGYSVAYTASTTATADSTIDFAPAQTYTSPALADGAYYVHLRAIDAAGNAGPDAYVGPFTIDASGPAAPVITSSHAQATWSSNPNVTFSWTASDQTGITGYSVLLDDVAGSDPVTVISTTLTQRTDSNLPDGAHFLHVRAVDGTGNWSATATYEVRIDKTSAPISSLTSSTHPSPNVWYAARDVTMTYAATDISGITGYSYLMSQSSTATPDSTIDGTSTSVSFGNLAEGTWYFSVVAVNGSGLVGAATQRRIQIDGTVPVNPSVTSSHGQTTWSSNPNVTFSWTVSDVSGIAGYAVVLDQTAGTVPAAAVTQTANTKAQTLADGTWYLHVRAVDGAGLWSNTTTYTVLIDSSAPVVGAVTSSTHPVASSWYPARDVTLSFGTTDVSGITGYSLVLDQTAGTVPDSTVDQAAATKTYLNLADGTWYVHVRAVNGAGLISPTVTRTINVDGTNPLAEALTSATHNTNGATNQNVVQLDWTAQPGSDAMSGIAGYNVTFNNAAGTAGGSTVTTTLTTAASSALADGTWFAHVRVVDKAGNVSPDVAIGPFTIDSLATPVSTADTAAFVALWQPRVTSDTFYVDYLATPAYPASILAEGFHGKNQAQKDYLIDTLFDALIANESIDVDLNETLSAVRDQVWTFVFDKTHVTQTFVTDFLDTITRIVTGTLPATTPLLDNLEVLRDIELSIPDEIAPDLPDLGLDDVVSDIEDAVEPAEEVVDGALSGDIQSTIDGATNAVDDVVGDVSLELAKVVNDVVSLDLSPVYDLTNMLPVSVGYAACWESATDSGCQDVAALGTPALLDVTGDGTTDVFATFGPHVDTANPLSVGFQLTVERSTLPLPNDTTNKPIKAHVWIVYDVGAYDTKLNVGFDGYRRGAQLSESTQVVLTLTQPTTLAERDVYADFSVTHTTPGSSWALTLGRRNITGDPDPIDLSAQFNPVVNLTGHVALVDDNDSQANPPTRDTRYEFGTDTDTRTKLDLVGTGTIAASNTNAVVHLLVDKLPQTTDLVVHDTFDGTNGTATVSVDNSDTISRLSVNGQVTSGTTRGAFLADVRDVPADMAYTLDYGNGRFHHSWDASSQVASVSAAISLYKDNVLELAGTGRVTNIAAHADLWHGPSDQQGDDRQLVSYTADAIVPTIDATGYLRSQAITGTFALRQLPMVITGSASLSAKTMEFQTSTPIGSLAATMTKGRATAYRPAGDHLTFVSNGSNIAVSGRISGLSAASGEFGTTLHGTVTLVPGGQAFKIVGQVGADYLVADVSNLPATMDILLERATTHAHYHGSAVIPTLKLYAGRRPGGPHIEATVSNIPTDIDLKATLTSSSTSLTYDANAPLSSITRVLATTDGTPNDKSGITLSASVSSIPSHLEASVDRSLKKASFSSNGPLGVIKLSVSRNGAKVQKVTGDHLTFNGTSSAWGLDAQLTGLQAAAVDLSQGIANSSASLALSPGGQSFVGNANLDGMRLYASISNLPPSFSYTANGLTNIHFDAGASINKLTLYAAKTGTGPTLRGTITATPTGGDLTASLAKPVYSVGFTGEGAVTSASAFYSTKYVDTNASATDNFISGSAKGFPSWFTATFDTDAKHIAFRSNRGLDEVKAQAKGVFVDGLNAEAVLRDLPANADVDFTTGDLLFDGHGTGIGYAFVRGSNHGAPPKRMAGRHLYARADLVNDLFDVSAEITNVTYAKVAKTATSLTLTGNVNLGASFSLDLRADMRPPNATTGPALRGAVRGTLDDFPTSLTVTADDDQITYTGNSQFDADLYAEFGYPTALAEAATPPKKFGVSVTDGYCTPGQGCAVNGNDGNAKLLCIQSSSQCLGVKARFYYTGLPKNVTVKYDLANNAGVVFGAAAPSKPEFTARVDVRHAVPIPLVVELVQKGVLSNKTMRFGPIRVGDDNKVHVETHHDADLGSLSINASAPGYSFTTGGFRFSNISARALLSNEPAYVKLDVNPGKTSSLTFNGSSGIDGAGSTPGINVHVQAKVEQQNGSSWTTVSDRANADVNVFEVPASPTTATSLAVTAPAIGDDAKGQTVVPPALSYSAPSGTLDGAFSVDPGMLKLGIGPVTARVGKVSFDFTNLAKDFNVSVNTSTYRVDLASTGDPSVRTGSVRFSLDKLGADLSIPFTKTWSKGGVGKVILTGNVSGHVASDAMKLHLTDIRDLHVIPGKGYVVAIGVTGDYGSFLLDTPGFDLDVDANAKLRIRTAPDYSWRDDTFVFEAGLQLNNLSYVSHVNDATKFGRVGPCMHAQIGIVPMSGSFQIKPAPQEVNDHKRNQIPVTGGVDHVISVLDPGIDNTAGHAWSNAVDIVGALWADPLGNGDWKVKVAPFNGAC